MCVCMHTHICVFTLMQTNIFSRALGALKVCKNEFDPIRRYDFKLVSMYVLGVCSV